MAFHVDSVLFGIVLAILQVIFLVLFGIFAEYGGEADARVYGNASGTLKTADIQSAGANTINAYYPSEYTSLPLQLIVMCVCVCVCVDCRISRRSRHDLRRLRISDDIFEKIQLQCIEF